jgi:hypothetical protein
MSDIDDLDRLATAQEFARAGEQAVGELMDNTERENGFAALIELYGKLFGANLVAIGRLERRIVELEAALAAALGSEHGHQEG